MPYYFVPHENGDMLRYRVSSSSSSTPPGNDDSIPSTVEEIFMNYIGRRLGFFRAFFRDANRSYASCDPEKENMCLYAHANGSWEVIYPNAELPRKLPQPALGINFARDGIPRNDWLAFVALLSDSWLLSLVSFFSARLSRHDRKCLFDMINDLPTLHEEVTKYHPNEICMRPGTESRDGTFC